MANAAIDISSLHVRRGGKVVLDDIDLSVGAGTVTGLVGPSGSGKTTLLRAIVGVQVVQRGEVLVLGRAAGEAALRPLVGYVTQAPAVYGDLTVRENLTYFARVSGASLDRVAAVLVDVGLDGFEHALVNRLSGGERARVSLATALVAEPRVLVLDEPTVGLDPVLRRDLWEMFASLARGGVTLVVSSHVMDEAARCDDLILLREGRVLYRGTPQDLRATTGTADLDAAFLTLIEGAA